LIAAENKSLTKPEATYFILNVRLTFSYLAHYGRSGYFPSAAFYHNGSKESWENRRKTHFLAFMKIYVKKKLEIARNGRLFTPKEADY
jgi:hypothetical protein